MKLLSVLLLAAVSAFAADGVAGIWTIEGSVAGYDLKETCTLKVDGPKLTGSCKIAEAAANEVTGEIAGDKVTFRHGGEYEGNPLTITYTATLAADGTMKGEIHVAPFDAAGEFAAKKTQ